MPPHKLSDSLNLPTRPGGILVNIGPLLFHYADMPTEESVEVSWEELRGILLAFGFEIEHEEFVDCHYTSNARSMMRTRYSCVHFVARKKRD
jgi:carnosine N-methyltransferase